MNSNTSNCHWCKYEARIMPQNCLSTPLSDARSNVNGETLQDGQPRRDKMWDSLALDQGQHGVANAELMLQCEVLDPRPR